MTGWSLCKLCRAVTWKDAAGRTFGCAVGCSNARSTTTPPPLPSSKADVEPAFEITQPSDPPVSTPYSADARGDCRPSWTKIGTGNFTMSQSSRFPTHKRRPGEGLSYDVRAATESRPRGGAAAFKDTAKRGKVEKVHPPPAVGPASYLRHSVSTGVDGFEMDKTYSSGGALMRSRSTRDIYGPGGMANLFMVSSPKSTNAYINHDTQKSWNKKLAHNKLTWVSKGSSFPSAPRFKKSQERAPAPGAYYDLHGPAFSSVRKRQIYVDLDEKNRHGMRPFTN